MQPQGRDVGPFAAADEPLHLFQLQQRLLIMLVRSVKPYVGNQEDSLLQMVEDDDLIEQKQVEIQYIFIVVSLQMQRRLGVLDIIVGDVSDKAAGKGRKAVDAGRRVVC